MLTLRYLRRAGRDFRGVLDQSLFYYMKFEMNKYFKKKIEDATTYCEVLGGFIIIILYLLALYGILRSAAIFF